MSKVLVILAHPHNQQHSNSLDLYDAFIAEYQKQHPSDSITVRDLFAEDEKLTGIDNRFFELQGKLANQEEVEEASQAILSHSEELLQEFIDHDKYVFVNPMYNLFLPYQLKMYMDNVTVAKRTFKYTPEGQQVGLLKGRKALHLQSTGSFHQEFNNDYASQYLEGILNFNGIDDVTHITVEGMDADPKNAPTYLEAGKKRAIEFAKEF